MVNRRTLLRTALATTAAACAPRGPAILRRAPRLSHGVQSGDVGGGSATVWARGEEPGLLEIEWDTTERFAQPRRVARVEVTPATDLTGTAELTGLPVDGRGQTIWYRIRLVRSAARGTGEWTVGRLRTPSAERVRFTWSGDTCGQGFGINDEWGGLQGYRAMRELEPAFFVHAGDLIYADNPILPELTLPDGKIWRNRSNPRVARVAQELDDFRARFAYNFDDEHVCALAAEVPIVATWDDHETRNNWWPGQVLSDERYTRERSASQLAAWARQATLEWTPIRRRGANPPLHRQLSYGPLLDVFLLDLRAFRQANDANRGPRQDMLGTAQRTWFVDAMARSQAVWKVVVCSQPLGLLVPDGEQAQEGWANGEGPPLGRELELAAMLEELHRRDVRNALWLTADVHYAAAHHYDPARATGAVFSPFWELVSGPLHAGAFGPNPLDPTFGPEVRWQKAVGAGAMGAPWDGFTAFGSIELTREALTARQHGVEQGAAPWWTMTLPRQG
ncbi:MAG: alkaline phosphatase D family protein [Myxococcales bacterium]|nr:alkaline phosphatase D family protein [Myxococcales bacterium]